MRSGLPSGSIREFQTGRRSCSPIRPDNQAGRIGQQSSCFTLHMHNAGPCANPTLARIKVPGGAKPRMLDELRKLNINEFSIYNDLDHLAEEIRRTRNLP